MLLQRKSEKKEVSISLKEIFAPGMDIDGCVVTNGIYPDVRIVGRVTARMVGRKIGVRNVGRVTARTVGGKIGVRNVGRVTVHTAV